MFLYTLTPYIYYSINKIKVNINLSFLINIFVFFLSCDTMVGTSKGGYIRMKIDFHTHAYPDKIATNVIEKLTSVSGYHSTTDGTFASLSQYMLEQNTDKFVLLNIASSPKQQKSANDFVLGIQNPNCYPFIAAHPEAEDVYYEIDRGIDGGLKGIKFHPEYQNFDMDDKKFYKLYEYCLNKGLVLVFHTGYDPAFITKHSYPNRACTIADAFKTKQIVFAHLGNAENMEESFEYLSNKTVSFDISMAYYLQDAAKVTAFIKQNGADKFLYGTDTPFGNDDKTMEFLNSLNLTASEKNQILFKNAAELLKIKL